MKKVILTIGILLFMVSTAFGWGTCYKQFSSSGDNQEVLAVETGHYCRIKTVTVQNNGSTTATVSVHFEGTAGQFNRITPPSSLATGESIAVDYPENRCVTGPINADVDVDISQNTTVDVFLVYETGPNR